MLQSSAGLLSQSRLSDTRKQDSGEKERDRMGEVFPETKSNLIELKNSRKINTSESDFFFKVRAWGWRRETSQVGPPKCQDLKETLTVWPYCGGNRRKMGFRF